MWLEVGLCSMFALVHTSGFKFQFGLVFACSLRFEAFRVLILRVCASHRSFSGNPLFIWSLVGCGEQKTFYNLLIKS